MEGLGLGVAPAGSYLAGISVGIAASVWEREANGIVLGGLATVTGGTNGIAVGGLANVSDGALRGIAVGGLANVSSGGTQGVAIGGLANGQTVCCRVWRWAVSPPWLVRAFRASGSGGSRS